jgi:hypothetical protein
MKSRGEFVSCDLIFRDAPAQIAGLLKYKKHEWIVILFITQFQVRTLWWNKGPDGTRVWSFLRERDLSAAISSLRPDTIAMLHNHPNPDPSRLIMNYPSEADLRSAGFYSEKFGSRGVSLLEFICERGTPHLYYASFGDNVFPIKPIEGEIAEVNGTGILKNRSLRKELAGRSRAERIPGG